MAIEISISWANHSKFPTKKVMKKVHVKHCPQNGDFWDVILKLKPMYNFEYCNLPKIWCDSSLLNISSKISNRSH
jgi:hypothetical protein